MSLNDLPFEFRLLVAGIDLDDHDRVDALMAAFEGDASISATATDRVSEVLLTIDGSDPLEVVSTTIALIEHEMPDISVIRVLDELVGISDVAKMSGRSRESIRLLAEGKRGPGTFPLPVGTVGDSIRVWRWSDIDEWLRETAGFDFPTRPLPSWAIEVVNGWLQERDHKIPVDDRGRLVDGPSPRQKAERTRRVG
jgi:predicted DNA-binding transcriptional regulator AlpA